MFTLIPLKPATPSTTDWVSVPERVAPAAVVRPTVTLPEKSATTSPDGSSAETAAEKKEPAPVDDAGSAVKTALEAGAVVVTVSLVDSVAVAFTLGTFRWMEYVAEESRPPATTVTLAAVLLSPSGCVA